jgi:phosphate transport system substrate-binding protein
MKLNRLGSIRRAAVILAALGVACGGGAADSASTGSASSPTVVRIDGSSTVFPITEAVAEEFQKSRANVRVAVGISGTGGGFQKFCRGEIDIADASRPIKSSELEGCRAAGIEFVELPVAYDGIAVVVHPKNSWATSMTVAELKRLWEPAAQGTITRWSQIRTGWPDREIHLFGPGVDSGTFDYFTEVIAGKSGASRGDYTSSEDDNVLVQGVATDELALGYFGFAYFEANQGRLKLVGIDDGRADNGAGPLAPSVEAIRNGTYAPLSRPIFIYASQAALGRRDVAQFVGFYLEQGAALAREVGYVALADREAALVTRRFENRTTGTMFGAGSAGASLETRLAGGGR